MTARIPTAAQNVACDAIVNLLDAGAGPGVIEVYTGAQPASANDAATGTLLVTFALADPACGPVSSGVRTLLGVPIEGTPVADGEAGWFRAKDSNGATVTDGACGIDGSGKELILSSTSLVSGTPVSITAGTFTMPSGA